MMSMAFTKDVATKGRIRVRYSKWEYQAKIKAAVETKNRSQYAAVFFFCAMRSRIYANLSENVH